MGPDEQAKEETVEAMDRAIAKVNAGLPHKEVCGFCRGKLIVEGLPPGGPFTQWFIRCPCEKSKGLRKGI
jgi:hypothetical protein